MTDESPPDDALPGTPAPGDQPAQPSGETGGRSNDPSHDLGPHSEEIQHSQVSALVPERVGRGIFSTGAVVLQGPHEFIIDFLLRMAQPQQLAARVVLPPTVIAQFIAALGDNLRNYESKHGPPVVPNAPGAFNQPPPATPPVSAQELYEQLKLPEEVLSGHYANAVMIGHNPCEFCFDFITTFFPRSAVSCRVFLAAPNVPRLLDSLKHAYDKYQRRLKPPESA